MRQEGVYETIVCPATADNPRNSEACIIELQDGQLLLAYIDFYGGERFDASPYFSVLLLRR